MKLFRFNNEMKLIMSLRKYVVANLLEMAVTLYAIIVGSYACCNVAQVGRPGLIDHCDDVSPPPPSPSLPSQLCTLLSYGDGAGHGTFKMPDRSS